ELRLGWLAALLAFVFLRLRLFEEVLEAQGCDRHEIELGQTLRDFLGIDLLVPAIAIWSGEHDHHHVAADGLDDPEGDVRPKTQEANLVAGLKVADRVPAPGRW